MTVDGEFEFERERLRRQTPRVIRPAGSGGSPAFLGRVITASPAVGKFLLVHPVTVLGAETEGGAGTLTVDTSASVPVLLVGPAAAVTGDDLVCRFVGDRWVAERMTSGSGSGPVNLPGCPCTAVPRTLVMTLNNPVANNINNTWHSCTFLYQPSEPSYGFGANCHLSTSTFADDFQTIYGEVFYYWFRCLAGAVYAVGRVYHWSPFGNGPDLEGRGFGGVQVETGVNPTCKWLIGFGAAPNNNRCTPDFHLDKAVGQENFGSVTCELTIQG